MDYEFAGRQNEENHVPSFIIATENAALESHFDSTFAPNEETTDEAGVNEQFVPLRIPFRDGECLTEDFDPVSLFKEFVPENTVFSWVSWTNQTARTVRGPGWIDTTVPEVYTWLGLLIYMGIHKEEAIRDYWKSSTDDEEVPLHLPTRYMPRDRFLDLNLFIWPYDPDSIDPQATDFRKVYQKVNPWSNIIKSASNRLYFPGSFVAVDECMIRFTGRSGDTVKMPNKPIKEGFKIWAIAEGGYFLNWLWHSPQHILTSSQLHLQFQASSADNTITLNPTQSVVVSLLNTLRKATYHVFLDNLFLSPNLFRVLREQGFAATGTLRLNSGVHRDLVELKTLDRKGRLLWHWNQLLRLPTADHLVMQFAWKDSKLVLIASTNYNGLELVQAIRH